MSLKSKWGSWYICIDDKKMTYSGEKKSCVSLSQTSQIRLVSVYIFSNVYGAFHASAKILAHA